MPARYLIVMPPGVQVLGVGFLKAGDVYTSPSPDYQPPTRAVRPLNEEAAEAIRKELRRKAAHYVAAEKEAMETENKAVAREYRKVAAEYETEAKRVKVFVPPAPVANVQREAVRPDQLGKGARPEEMGIDRLDADREQKTTPSKRAADR